MADFDEYFPKAFNVSATLAQLGGEEQFSWYAVYMIVLGIPMFP